MNDLISRKAVIKLIRESADDFSKLVYGMVDPYDLAFKVGHLPSAEPEIIRCKNCIWFDRYTDGIEKYQWDGFCAEWARNTYENWYCGRAERR